MHVLHIDRLLIHQTVSNGTKTISHKRIIGEQEHSVTLDPDATVRSMLYLSRCLCHRDADQVGHLVMC